MNNLDDFRVNDIVRMINYKGDGLYQGTVKQVYEADRVYIKWDEDVKGIFASTEDISKLFNVSHYNRENNLMSKYQLNYKKLKLYLQENYSLYIFKLNHFFEDSKYNKKELFESESFNEADIGDKIIEEYNEKIMSQLIKKVK